MDKTKKSCLGIGIFFFLFFQSIAMGAPFFINAGFETGDLTGWDSSGSVSVVTSYTKGSTTVSPFEGDYMAVMSGSGGGSTLSQTLDNLTAGEEITISFYYYSLGGGLELTIDNGTTYTYTVSSGGKTKGWQSYSIDVETNGSLKITLSQTGGVVCVDNFSPVPILSSIWMLGTGLILLGILRFKNKIFVKPIKEHIEKRHIN